jgi:pyruvate dehydrogenase E1 component alpha subunit
MRMHGHGAHDDMSYVPKEMLEEWARRDPLDRYSERLVADHGFATEAIEELRTEVYAYVDECAQGALAGPMPEAAEATEGVFAERWEPLGDGQAPWSHWAQPAGSRAA